MPMLKHRTPALDWMRGIVMVLMATDHASGALNSRRLITDSVWLYDPNRHLDALQFAHRWLSHLCAPAFLFLAGSALALSVEAKRLRGVSASTIDRDILLRGLIVLAVDLLFINWFWVRGMLLLQVMYAIGLAMLLMIPVRRLPGWTVTALALLTLAAAELFQGESLVLAPTLGSLSNAFLMQGGLINAPSRAAAVFTGLGLPDKLLVLYPMLPWWAMMALGWSFGRSRIAATRTHGRSASPTRSLLVWGAAALGLFALLRGLNSYGNMALLRRDGSWVQWLHVSKYPPSITFVALELGLMALLLAGLYGLQGLFADRIRSRNPILVFGQTAFLFYLGHILLLELGARLLGMHQQRTLAASTTAALVVMTLLYPVCCRFRRLKADHPHSPLRFF